MALLAVTAIGLSPPLADECDALAESRAEAWFAMSGAEVVDTPMEHLNAELQRGRRELVAGSVWITQAGLSELFVFLDTWFDMTDTARVACAANGGRFFEVTLRGVKRHHFVELDASLVPPGLAEHALKIAMAMLGDASAGAGLKVAACAPAVCALGAVRRHLLRFFFGRLLVKVMGAEVLIAAPRPPWLNYLRAVELGGWRDLSLDFAVIGFDNCGTTSMHRNLARHPGIAFTADDEDSFFQSNRLLPARHVIAEFNRRRALVARGMKYGLYDSNILGSRHALHQLRRIPGLTLVVVVCDPLGRFEKRIYKHLWCERRHDRAQRGNSTAAASPAPCLRSMSESLAHLDRDRMGPRLLEARALFEGHLVVVHQALLRIRPGAVYDAVARLLGVGPFPAGSEFHRFNSVKGHRTDLCRNASLVQLLKCHLRSDYDAVEAAVRGSGWPLPTEALHRVTRCERPEELGALDVRCDDKRLCE